MCLSKMLLNHMHRFYEISSSAQGGGEDVDYGAIEVMCRPVFNQVSLSEKELAFLLGSVTLAYRDHFRKRCLTKHNL